MVRLATMLVRSVIFLLPALASGAMSDFFMVHPSCDAQLVDALLDDTVDMLDRTLEAIALVKTTTGTFALGSNKRNIMRNSRHAFGTGNYKVWDTTLSPADRTTLDRVQGEPEACELTDC